VHCPPRTRHTIVATGDAPCLIFAVGARTERGSARYPVDAAAVRRSAGVEQAADSPAEAITVVLGADHPRGRGGTARACWRV
jgi:hypothetical protein